MQREYEVLKGEVIFTHRGERHGYAAQGISSGGAGALAHSVIYRLDGTTEVINSKIRLKHFLKLKIYLIEKT